MNVSEARSNGVALASFAVLLVALGFGLQACATDPPPPPPMSYDDLVEIMGRRADVDRRPTAKEIEQAGGPNAYLASVVEYVIRKPPATATFTFMFDNLGRCVLMARGESVEVKLQLDPKDVMIGPDGKVRYPTQEPQYDGYFSALREQPAFQKAAAAQDRCR